MIKTLDPREATILRYRFGLDGGSEKTLEEVGEKFGVTRERVERAPRVWGEPAPVDLIAAADGRYIGTLEGIALPLATSRSGHASGSSGTHEP